MNIGDFIGYCAAICTTISFLPQVIKVLKTRNTQSLSLSMYVTFVLGVSLWLIYGLVKEDLPIIIANILTLIFSSLILSIKISNRKKDRRSNF